MIYPFGDQRQARLKELKALDEEIESKKHAKIIYDNSSAELPMLQLSISDEIEGQTLRTIGMVARGREMKDCERGMDYLLSKHKDISKRKLGSKYKDNSWG